MPDIATIHGAKGTLSVHSLNAGQNAQAKIGLSSVGKPQQGLPTGQAGLNALRNDVGHMMAGSGPGSGPNPLANGIPAGIGHPALNPAQFGPWAPHGDSGGLKPSFPQGPPQSPGGGLPTAGVVSRYNQPIPGQSFLPGNGDKPYTSQEIL